MSSGDNRSMSIYDTKLEARSCTSSGRKLQFTTPTFAPVIVVFLVATPSTTGPQGALRPSFRSPGTAIEIDPQGAESYQRTKDLLSVIELDAVETSQFEDGLAALQARLLGRT